MTQPSVSSDAPQSTRLMVALVAVLVFHLTVTLVAYLRVGHWNPLTSISRPLILLVLGLLAVQRRTWARWLLVAWLGLGAIAAFSELPAAAGLPLVQLLFLLLAGLNIWAVVELTLDSLADPTSKSTMA